MEVPFSQAAGRVKRKLWTLKASWRYIILVQVKSHDSLCLSCDHRPLDLMERD